LFKQACVKKKYTNVAVLSAGGELIVP